MSAPPVSAAALHLRADGISFSYPDRRVLTDASLVVPAGRPTGLLGENGSGKTTLLRILAGRLEADAGTVEVPGPVGLLRHELPLPASVSLAEVVEDALSRSRRLERDLTAAGEELAAADGELTASLTRRYDDLLAAATLADVWNAAARAEEVLEQLRLGGIAGSTRLGEISGGQRERLALAHLLIARPASWLLDEPTDHLDDDGAAFLTRTIAAHPGPVLIASHDRAFLDEATTAQADLDPAESPLHESAGAITVHTGGFSDYLLARLDARERWERRFTTEQEELKRLRTAVSEAGSVGHEGRGPRTEARAAKKFYADRNAKVVSRRLRDARDRLHRLETEQVRKPPAEPAFTALPAAAGAAGSGAADGTGSPRPAGAGAPGAVLLAASLVAVTGRLRPTSVTLAAGQKLLITGPNGAGKSTLLDVLTGQLPADEGTVNRPASLRIGHLGQDDHPVPGRTVRSHLLRAAVGEKEPADHERVPELFGLIHPRDLDRPLELLSRGQLRRAMLAAILLDPPDLLVLDEPTNHLALVTATRVEAALQEWGGTVLIASHDRWLRERWRGEVTNLPA